MDNNLNSTYCLGSPRNYLQEKIKSFMDENKIKISSTIESEVLDSKFNIPDSNLQVNDDAWQTILSLVKPINASVEALLRSSKPVAYDGKTLTLGVFYKFHKERLEDSHHRVILETTIAKVLQSPTKVVCTLLDPPLKVIPVLTESKDQDIIKAAEELFSN